MCFYYILEVGEIWLGVWGVGGFFKGCEKLETSAQLLLYLIRSECLSKAT